MPLVAQLLNDICLVREGNRTHIVLWDAGPILASVIDCLWVGRSTYLTIVRGDSQCVRNVRRRLVP